MSKAFLFSGQGSQYVGMTNDLVQVYDVARAMAGKANEILGYDLHAIMTGGPEDELRKTKHTQPALFLHEAMILALTSMNGVTAVAGHSLGEYSALHAAGVLTFEDALGLVQLRAQLMWDAGNNIPGTMAAVVGMDVQVQNDRMRFRRNIERIGEVIAYEISKQLPSEEVNITTPL